MLSLIEKSEFDPAIKQVLLDFQSQISNLEFGASQKVDKLEFSQIVSGKTNQVDLSNLVKLLDVSFKNLNLGQNENLQHLLMSNDETTNSSVIEAGNEFQANTVEEEMKHLNSFEQENGEVKPSNQMLH